MCRTEACFQQGVVSDPAASVVGSCPQLECPLLWETDGASPMADPRGALGCISAEA